MSSVLDRQLELFDREARSEAWKAEQPWDDLCRELDRVLAFGIALIEQLEEAGSQAQPPGKWSEEEARKFVPYFVQWHRVASGVLDTARTFKRKGYAALKLSDFAHAFNRSKFMVDFERLAESVRFVENGGRGRRLEDIDAELRLRDDSGG